MSKFILIQLNEINFEIVSKYINQGCKLEYFKKVLETAVDTYEDEKYENLEPWIQWVSIFKGKPYKDHRIFHLGDGLKSVGDNLFFDIKDTLGMSCGAVAPMNIPSEGIDFDFYIPDPWSNGISIGNPILNYISGAISQGVNDNSGKGINLKNKIKLILGLLLILKPKEIIKVINHYLNIKGLSYKKALFLDYLLVLLQQRLSKNNSTDFSSVFLNAGAHIQHHYFFNSKVINNNHGSRNPNWYIDENLDPLEDALIFYNEILKSYEDKGYKLILMTGLQQIPCNNTEYYYRLANHSKFIKSMGIKYDQILPRMTRDFEIIFKSNSDRDSCENKLAQITDEVGNKVFGELDIRDRSIFCSLTYPNEITNKKDFIFGRRKFKLAPHVNFVAIKNGKHDKNGKLFISDVNLKKKFKEPIQLSEIRGIITSEILLINDKKSVKEIIKN